MQRELPFTKATKGLPPLEPNFICEHCNHEFKKWRISMVSTAVASLLTLARKYKGKAMHFREFAERETGGNFSQLAKWGLIIPERNTDSKKRTSGKWHPTLIGMRFAQNLIKIEKYCIVEEREILRFEGPMISIKEALGQHFDYNKLMLKQG